MLSIGDIRPGAGVDYHQRQIADGRDDYYAGKGEAPGEWAGRMAGELGVAGRIDREGHAALVAGAHPSTGEPLGRGGRGVLAYDLTFSAPKSVSVLFAGADEETSGRLVEAHEQAVSAGLDYLEREACRVRRGHAGAEQLPADGFWAARYRHRMSREQDPQLHTHVVVANLGRGPDGRWTALHGYRLYQHAQAAGYLYEAQLRAAVRERLPWVEWGPVRKGIAEVEGVPAELLQAFSRRRGQILEWLEENGRSGRRSAEKAALATRRAKPVEAIDTPSWRERVQLRLAEFEFEPVLERLRARAPVAERPVDAAAVRARLSGPEGLTDKRNAFAGRQALREWAAAHQQGASGGQVEREAAGYLAGGEVVELGDGELYTTEGLLAAEAQIVKGAERRAAGGTGRIAAGEVERLLQAHGGTLTGDQLRAVLAVTASGRGVDVVEALAGTGKTYTAGAVGGVYRAAGYRVLATAPTGRAVRELKERAGIADSSTLTRLAGELADGGGFGAGPVLLLLDEAGMASTREAARVFRFAEQAGVKVVAIGDSGQLTSVQAGGWLGALSRRQGALQLTEVVRQRDAAERRRLAEVHDGRPDRYLRHKLGGGELELHASAGQAERRALAAWWAAQSERRWGEATLVARDNATRSRLNAGARALARADGRLGETLAIEGVEFAVGDRVITRRNDRFYDVDNGTRGTVRAVDPERQLIVLESDAGGLHRLPADYAAVHLEHGYALTGHGSQGGTVDWAAVVGAPEDFSRNWAYTALSRAREPTRVYISDELPPALAERVEERAAVAPQPAGPPGDPLGRLARAMRTPDDEPLALERLEAHAPPPLPDVHGGGQAAAPTGELRAELAALEARLRSFPQAAADELDRAAARRLRAERQLDDATRRIEQLDAARPGRRLGRRRAEPAELAVQRQAAEQAQRDRQAALAEERKLAGLVPNRAGWEAEHAPLRDRAQVARDELARRRERSLERTLSQPGPELTAALGERPPDARRRQAWERAVRAVAGYCFDGGADVPGSLGPRPQQHDRARAWRDATRELDRAQRTLGRAPDRNRDLSRGRG